MCQELLNAGGTSQNNQLIKMFHFKYTRYLNHELRFTTIVLLKFENKLVL